MGEVQDKLDEIEKDFSLKLCDLIDQYQEVITLKLSEAIKQQATPVPSGQKKSSNKSEFSSLFESDLPVDGIEKVCKYPRPRRRTCSPG